MSNSRFNNSNQSDPSPNNSFTERTNDGYNRYTPPHHGRDSYFRPKGFSSPVNYRSNKWHQRQSNYSYGDHPGSAANSPNFSGGNRGGGYNPYERRNNSRHSNSFNNAGRSEADISLYYSHDMVLNPWQDLEEKLMLDMESNLTAATIEEIDANNERHSGGSSSE